MKLLKAAQFRAWDQYTISHLPILSIDLMEHAAMACVNWMNLHVSQDEFFVFCGTGNNGGDGLAIARLLLNLNKKVSVCIIRNDAGESADFTTNLNRLRLLTQITIYEINNTAQLPAITTGAIIVDALFGTGLNRPLTGIYTDVINQINQSGNTVISIDIPSGLYCDKFSTENTVIQATHTLTFQCLKYAFLLPENERFTGEHHTIDIGLLPDYLSTIDSNLFLTDIEVCLSIYKPRTNFSHKGSFGHALIIAGSYGKSGAAVLAAKACLKAGAGLVTAYVPGCTLPIMQVVIPEVMAIADPDEKQLSDVPFNLDPYATIGIGPGIGINEHSTRVLEKLLHQYNKPIVIDADALNILSENNNLFTLIPPLSILTPHPKEFSRLFGKTASHEERIQRALLKAGELNIIIVLKGHYTFIALPNGQGYFNTTGNPGMATGGSGDALTGIITGLLSQGYSPENSALFGVWLHGASGDLAAKYLSMESMTAMDIIDHMPQAFKQISFK